MNKRNKLRCKILKLRMEGKNPLVELKGKVDEKEILNQGKFLANEGWIEKNKWADNTIWIWGNLTLEGEKFLKDNSRFSRFCQCVKEIKDWMKIF